MVEAHDAPYSEIASHLVDDVGEPKPPKHCTRNDGQVAQTLSEPVAWDDKRQHVEEGDEKENDKGVRKRDEKSRGEIMHQSAFAVGNGTEAFPWISLEHIDAEDEEHDASEEFEPENVVLVVDEIHDERHSESGHQRIDDVAQCSSCASHDSVVAPLLYGSLDAQDTDGSHWCRSYDANQ